jgi:hypothetical protein
MEKTQPSDPPIEAIERGYEVGDVSVKGATYVTIGFIVLAIITHAFLTLVWKVTYSQAKVFDPERSAVLDERPPVNRPPLQPSRWHDFTPKQDMTHLRDQEAQTFRSIGWEKPSDKTGHVSDNTLPRIPDAIVEKVSTRPGMPSTRPAGGSR